MSSFYERFAERRSKLASVLCVGLDPDPARVPEGYETGDIINQMLLFLGDIIESTAPYAVAYKANLAFFEGLGGQGFILFNTLVKVIRQVAPGALIIADAKRGDIGNTAEQYAKAYFEHFECDAITVSPYMGFDAVRPFAQYRDHATIVLCHTSNEGALDFQEMGDPPVYLRVAQKAAELHRETGNLWLVVGATRNPDAVRSIRAAAPDVPFLIPGVGAQGGDLEATLEAAGDDALINVSRSLLYASEHRDAVQDMASAASRELVDRMREFLKN